MPPTRLNCLVSFLTFLVRAAVPGFDRTCEGPVSSKVKKVYLLFLAVPVDWTQALWVCQNLW